MIETRAKVLVKSMGESESIPRKEVRSMEEVEEEEDEQAAPVHELDLSVVQAKCGKFAGQFIEFI